MDVIKHFELQWLERSASSVDPSSWQVTMLPSVLMAVIVIWAFLFSYLRSQLKYLPHLNLLVLVGIIGSFQACSQKPSNSSQQMTGVSPSLPSGANDLGDYTQGSGTNPNSGYQNIRVFNPKQGSSNIRSYADRISNSNPNNAVVWGYQPSNIQRSVAAECLNYNALFGKTITYDESTGKRKTNSCEFIRTWDDFAGDDDDPPSIGVKRVLNECRTSSAKLVLDLNIGLSNDAIQTPLLRVKNGTPFPVLAYCIRDNGNNNPTVQLLNPEVLSYEIVPDSTNTYSTVSHFEGAPGWFIGAFNDYEGGRVSNLSTTIRLYQNQGSNQQQGAAQPLNTPLPAVKVVVVPEGTNAAMAEYKMMTTLTDAIQEPIRGSPRVEIINPANGEVAFEHTDFTYPLPENSLALTFTRSYRSFNNEIGDFGYNWSWVPSQEFYAFATPIGDMGSYTFYRTDDGRLVSKDTGPFWEESDDNPLRPDPTKNFFLWGTENSLFDLSGRLISLFDGATGNRLYYLRNGSSVALIADQIAARTSLRGIITAMQSATSSYNPLNPSPTSINRAQIRSALMNLPGNFLYFLRNSKGYIQAIIDKSGNFSWYYYGPADGSVSGSGATNDYLNRVVRYVTQDQIVTGASEDSLILYNYAYVGDEDFGKTFSGLIKRAETWDRTEAYVENITYARNPRRFGAQPQVESATIRGLDYEFAYDYENFEDPEDPHYTTTITDWKGSSSSTIYKMNPAGQVVQIDGPTETSNREVLYQAQWDPKLLRITNDIQRGVETVYTWNEESGFLDSVTKCADRDDSGNRLVATLDDGGCANSQLARTTSYHPQYRLAWMDEWFKDISGTIQPLDTRPPSTGLYYGSRDTLTESIGCFGGKGVVNFAGQRSGTTCTRTNDPNGGSRLTTVTSDQFEDGSDRSSTSISSAARFNGSGLPPYWVPSNIGVFANVNQSSYQVNMPAAGISRAYDPTTGSLQNLSGNISVYRGIYGEALATKHPWGAETRKYYDYRTPNPVAVGTKVINLRPVNGNDFESAAGLTGRLTVDAVTMELGERPRSAELEAESRRAFGVQSYSGGNATFDSNAEAVSRFLTSMSLDAKARPWVEFAEDGSKATHTYTAWGAVDAVVTEIRKNSSSATLSLTTDLQYEASSRRLSKTVNPDGTSEETKFRTSFDRGQRSTVNDRTAIGGLKTETEVINYDWAGRPLSIRTRILSGSTNAPTETIIDYTYAPFGEVSSEVTRSGGTTTTVQHAIDSISGATVETWSQVSGTNVDTTQVSVNFTNFDKNLNPRSKTEMPKALVTETSGVLGKNMTTTVMGPREYENGYQYESIYSQVTEKYDGCGNIIRRENNSGSQIFGEEWEVNYEGGLCKVANYYPHIVFSPSPPSGYAPFSTRYGYMSDGSPTLTNERYQGVVGLEGSITFSNAFVSDCARDSVGRCTQAGRIYSLEASAHSSGLNMFVEYAKTSSSSSNGTPLVTKNYVSDRITEESASITSPTQVAMSYGSLGSSNFTQLLNSEIASQNRSGGGSYTSTKAIDPAFGVATLTTQIRSNPLTGSSENSSLSQTIDQYGRVISTSFSGGGMSRSSNILQWHLGQPKEVRVATTFASSGSETQTVRHDLMAHDKPLQTTYSRTQGALTFTGTQSFSRDGTGRPVQTTYTQQTPSNLNSYQLTHTRDITYDQAGRVIEERSDLQDTLTGSTATYDMGSYQLNRTPRENMIGGFQPLTVTTEYTQTGVKMFYSGFQVEYFLGQGPGREGRIQKVVVIDPAGQTHTYAINQPVTSTAPMGTDPLIGLRDHRAGQMRYLDEDRPWWDFIGITSNPPPVVRNDNRELPKFVIPWTQPFTPSEGSCPSCLYDVDRQFNINLTNNIPTGIDGTSFTGNNLLNSSITFPRNSATPSSFVCDRGGAVSRVGALSTVFDEQRRLAYAERQITKGGINGIPGIYKLQVFNAYDSFGLPALREQVISFRSTQTGNAYSGANFLPVQVIQNMRLNAMAPEGVQFPQRALTLVEYEQRAISSRSGTNELTRLDLRWTPMVYVWGPSGPLFSFARTGGGSWQRRDFIYDHMGNIKNTRCSVNSDDSCQSQPKVNESYLPYLTSVVSEYEGPMTYQNVGGSEYYVSGTYPNSQPARHSFSWEPNIQPLTSRFGAMGSDRDILGVHYTNGTSYDPMSGEFLSPESFNDSKICNEEATGVANAQAVADAALARESGTQATMTRATSEAAKAVFVQDAYFKNAPWWFYASPGFLVFGLYYAHDLNGTGWYFKEQAMKAGPIGWQVYAGLKAVDFLCTGDFMRATPGTLMDYWGQAQIGLCVADVVTLGASAAARQGVVQGGKAVAKAGIKASVQNKAALRAWKMANVPGYADRAAFHAAKRAGVISNVEYGPAFLRAATEAYGKRIGGGSMKTVFVHPYDPTLVVKMASKQSLEQFPGKYLDLWKFEKVVLEEAEKLGVSVARIRSGAEMAEKGIIIQERVAPHAMELGEFIQKTRLLHASEGYIESTEYLLRKKWIHEAANGVGNQTRALRQAVADAEKAGVIKPGRGLDASYDLNVMIDPRNGKYWFVDP